MCLRAWMKIKQTSMPGADWGNPMAGPWAQTLGPSQPWALAGDDAGKVFSLVLFITHSPLSGTSLLRRGLENRFLRSAPKFRLLHHHLAYPSPILPWGPTLHSLAHPHPLGEKSSFTSFSIYLDGPLKARAKAKSLVIDSCPSPKAGRAGLQTLGTLKISGKLKEEKKNRPASTTTRRIALLGPVGAPGCFWGFARTLHDGAVVPGSGSRGQSEAVGGCGTRRWWSGQGFQHPELGPVGPAALLSKAPWSQNLCGGGGGPNTDRAFLLYREIGRPGTDPRAQDRLRKWGEGGGE